MMQKGFYLHTCNNMEQLAAQYCQYRRENPEQFYSNDLFTEERIVIPSRTIRQWLERTVADQGVFLANVNFMDIRTLQKEVLCRNDADGTVAENLKKFGRKTMTWRIMDVLQHSLDEFNELKKYIEACKIGESADLRSFSLADKIAALFNSYLENTPEYLAREIGDPENFWQAKHWQAKLWQKLCFDKDNNVLLSPADLLITFLNGSEIATGTLPITVFGAGSIAPSALQLLKKLSLETAVNFFCFNPVDLQWQQEARQAWETDDLQDEPDEIKHFFQNQLLDRWGRHERQFFQTMLDLVPTAMPLNYVDTPKRKWYSHRQEQHLQQRSSTAETLPPPQGVLQGLQKALKEDNPDLREFAVDDTITFHNCHNPLREVEILHDHLLHLIETRKYTNSDIIVAAPDISLFEPYVHAVFDRRVPVASPAAGSRSFCRLSYSFYGLSGHQTNPLAETFLNLLDIRKSRYEYSFVERLLMTPEVRKRFNLSDQALQILHDWCQNAGIYWGKDGNREQYDLPNYENFSWRHGLDRMLLGMAVEEAEDFDNHWNNLAPFSQCDSIDNRSILRALLAFFRDLQKVEELLNFSGTIEEWKERLKEIISTFFACDLDRKAFYRGLINSVGLLSSYAKWADYSKGISLEVIRKALSDLLSVPADDEEFLRGNITFCNLRDARSVPCKVLCLLGMDESAFPQTARPDSFNLFEDKLDKVYRSPRFQERYVFLETLLGVRDYLLIYYRGQDDIADKTFAPSMVVTELFQYIRGLFPDMTTEDAEVKHELLFYSHSYFAANVNHTLNSCWSYNQAACSIDKTLNDKELERVFFSDSPEQSTEDSLGRRASYRQGNLFPPDNPALPVSIDVKDLEGFLYNGGFAFLKNSFGFPEPLDFNNAPQRIEPFNPDKLAEWKIKDTLSRWLVEKLPETVSFGSEAYRQFLDQCHIHFCNQNLLPAGEFGRQQLKLLADASWLSDDTFRNMWRSYCKNKKNNSFQLEFADEILQLPDEPIETLANFNTWDENRPLYSKVILQCSTKKLKYNDQIMLSLGSRNPKYQSRLFLRHLFFCANGENIMSHLIINDNDYFSLPAVTQECARERLKKIIPLYLYGKKHPVPTLNRCMWESISDAISPSASFDDKSLEYFKLLWGEEQLDAGLEEVITKLQPLTALSAEN